MHRMKSAILPELKKLTKRHFWSLKFAKVFLHHNRFFFSHLKQNTNSNLQVVHSFLLCNGKLCFSYLYEIIYLEKTKGQKCKLKIKKWKNSPLWIDLQIRVDHTGPPNIDGVVHRLQNWSQIMHTVRHNKPMPLQLCWTIDISPHLQHNHLEFCLRDHSYITSAKGLGGLVGSKSGSFCWRL